MTGLGANCRVPARTPGPELVLASMRSSTKPSPTKEFDYDDCWSEGRERPWDG
jgi:hypothetical protein